MKDIVEIQVNIGCGPSWGQAAAEDGAAGQLEALRRAERIMTQLRFMGVTDLIEVGATDKSIVANGGSDERTICARWRVDSSDVMQSVRCIARYAHKEEDQAVVAYRVLGTSTASVNLTGLVKMVPGLSCVFDPDKFIIPHAWLVIDTV